jgi:Mg2+ and Co2+ transporter CorA
VREIKFTPKFIKKISKKAGLAPGTLVHKLEWKWGYYAVWFIMAVLIISMISYFKRKSWL